MATFQENKTGEKTEESTIPKVSHSLDAQKSATTTPGTSDEHHIMHRKQLETAPRSATNSKLQETKSKTSTKISETAPLSPKTTGSTTNYSSMSPLTDKRSLSGNKVSKILRFICPCCFTSLTQNATIENSTQVTNDQENHELPNSLINRNDDQILLEVSDHNDCNTNYAMSDETTSNILCIDSSHLDEIETKEEDNTRVLCSVDIHEDISISNKQDDDHDKIMTEGLTKVNTIEHVANGVEKLDTIVPQYDQSDTFNNNTLSELTKKQEEMKAYYESFPDIDDVMDETGPDIKKAKEFTESILSKVPSGDVADRNTACHVLSKLFGNEHQQCLFYDSKNGIKLHDAFQNIADTSSQERPFVLKLRSSNGLGNIEHGTTKQDDAQLVQTLNNVIEQKQSHPVLDDIIERLAKAHGVNKEDIVIENLYVGTVGAVYTVKNSSGNNVLPTTELKQNLKNQFPEFVSVKIHPLLQRPSFDISYFDSRGNKSFPSKSTTFEVGPLGRKKSYTTPCGWTRYGLKVLGKFADDYWLNPFQHPKNWYRAFHGTRRAQSQDFSEKIQLSDKQYACVDATASIYLNGFCKARVHACGEGVYCSPNPKFPEGAYVGTVSLNTKEGTKKYKCMLQVAVNPDGVKCATNDIWVVPDPKDIRPYGILIKEVSD